MATKSLPLRKSAYTRNYDFVTRYDKLTNTELDTLDKSLEKLDANTFYRIMDASSDESKPFIYKLTLQELNDLLPLYRLLGPCIINFEYIYGDIEESSSETFQEADFVARILRQIFPLLPNVLDLEDFIGSLSPADFFKIFVGGEEPLIIDLISSMRRMLWYKISTETRNAFIAYVLTSKDRKKHVEQFGTILDYNFYLAATRDPKNFELRWVSHVPMDWIKIAMFKSGHWDISFTKALAELGEWKPVYDSYYRDYLLHFYKDRKAEKVIEHMAQSMATDEIARLLLNADEDPVAYTQKISDWLQKRGARSELIRRKCLRDTLEKLPTIPAETLTKAEAIAKEQTFNVHNERIHVLRGLPLDQIAARRQDGVEFLRRWDSWENAFRKGSKLDLDHAYVFRGLRVDSWSTVNLDPASVTFAGTNLSKAERYASHTSYTSRAGRYSVIFAIRIDRNFPIIRTDYDEEIVFPRNAEIVIDESIPQCSIEQDAPEYDDEESVEMLERTEDDYDDEDEESRLKYKKFMENYERESTIRVVFCKTVPTKRKRIVTLKRKSI